ncbi:SDR family oxidoreductase [Streptomyces sp. ST2-7A]|uniref:SDR family oxidoreductase n=1 Tax=Streptomyces sp. ST2-7A TaxID=2907214 RepID=UPI001F3FEB86|nr:SDR family oxidoreductase [Streptomyces sp. ST2-7A]MCE7083347.1 SDR family oxidoreductase [Streptomyces sp. ST2-7A]
MTTSAEADVIVVGAGPVGLFLAGDLRRRGVGVTVLERLAEPMTESRASTVHARTMTLFEQRGLLDRFGPLPSGGTGHFGGIPLDLAAAGPGHPHAGQWKCPQTRIEAVLQAWATDLGARIRRGHEVVGLSQRAGAVVVEVRGPEGRPASITGRYVVGCDGEDSTVRRAAGIDFPGHGATKEMLRADVAGIDVPNRRFERHTRGMVTAHRWPDGTTRLMVHEFGRAPRRRTRGPSFEEIAAAWSRVTGEDIGAGRPVWLNSFGTVSRLAVRYRRGHVLLAGDAAHAQMPVGGQALNLGLQDAAALGRRLSDRITGRAGDSVLDSYHDERHPVGARTLRHIEAQSQLLLGGPEVEPVRALFEELLGLDSARRHIARAISALDVPETSGKHTTDDRTTYRRTAMGKLTGRTALVTGASRGIGRATALRLARLGALVAVHYGTNAEAAAETVALIEGEGGRAFALRAELGTSGDVHELFLGLEQGLKERTGTVALDIVVNNAAIMGGVAPEDVTPELFDRLVAVNAKAPYFIVQRALPLIPDGGRVINISSGLTRVANPQEVAYAMTKGAIEQITLHLARHLGPRGITVNSVAPGITDNGSPVFDIPEAVDEMAQLSAFNRVGQTGDVADVVAFLATDEARWITGAFLDASGGSLLG